MTNLVSWYARKLVAILERYAAIAMLVPKSSGKWLLTYIVSPRLSSAAQKCDHPEDPRKRKRKRAQWGSLRWTNLSPVSRPTMELTPPLPLQWDEVSSSSDISSNVSESFNGRPAKLILPVICTGQFRRPGPSGRRDSDAGAPPI